MAYGRALAGVLRPLALQHMWSHELRIGKVHLRGEEGCSWLTMAGWAAQGGPAPCRRPSAAQLGAQQVPPHPIPQNTKPASHPTHLWVRRHELLQSILLALLLAGGKSQRLLQGPGG